ncbi:hypothetical protein [Streptomyces sp. NPDC086010]|uniref:hypothetical protein n=1 Tax=Streptomyces sp. NPDC086010 TaxID=3365745 RepID=UPI0037D1D2D5
MVVETGKPVGDEELGINPGTLHSWISRWRRNGTTSSDRPAQAASGGRVWEAEREELEKLRRETGEKNKRPGGGDGARCLQAMHGPLGEVTESDPEALVAFIGNQRVEHGVPHRVACRVACRVVGVSEAWFYKMRRRPDEPTKREVRRSEIEDRIVHFFRGSGETSRSPAAVPSPPAPAPRSGRPRRWWSRARCPRRSRPA